MIEEKYLMETHWKDYTEGHTDEAIVLSAHIGVDLDEVVHYIDDQDYLVLTDKEADEAVRDHIAETVWAFNPSFLSAHTGIDEEVFKLLQEKCEGANDAIMSMIKNFDHFVEDAVACDGRGHFLAGYDGDEDEVTYKSIDNNTTTYYIYRRN
tara:strand:+ start:113 stop:568 length:456 start_codon:yes stop_codon:yes gene_type:complete